jgi:hypothetical protein
VKVLKARNRLDLVPASKKKRYRVQSTRADKEARKARVAEYRRQFLEAGGWRGATVEGESIRSGGGAA